MQRKLKYITLRNKNFTLLGNKNYYVEYNIMEIKILFPISAQYRT